MMDGKQDFTPFREHGRRTIVAMFISLIECVALVLFGFMVGTVLVAVLLPMYNSVVGI